MQQDDKNQTEDIIVTAPHENRDLDTLIANLHIVREQTKELEQQAEELEKRLNLARGTGDVTAQAQAAIAQAAEPPKPTRTKPVERKPSTPKERVAEVLRGHSMNVAQISKATGISVGKVVEALRQLRADKAVANVGSEDFPQWTLRIGDNTSTQDLIKEVGRLISERPLTTQELVDITGAKMTRVSGAVVHYQRTAGPRILNLGHARRAKWLLLSPGVQVANLQPKARS